MEETSTFSPPLSVHAHDGSSLMAQSNRPKFLAGVKNCRYPGIPINSTMDNYSLSGDKNLDVQHSQRVENMLLKVDVYLCTYA